MAYAQIPDEVLLDRTISPQAKALYALLDHYAGAKGECFPGQQCLATDLGASTRSVKRWMAELEGRGYVDVVRATTASGTRAPNRYRLPLRQGTSVAHGQRARTPEKRSIQRTRMAHGDPTNQGTQMSPSQGPNSTKPKDTSGPITRSNPKGLHPEGLRAASALEGPAGYALRPKAMRVVITARPRDLLGEDGQSITSMLADFYGLDEVTSPGDLYGPSIIARATFHEGTLAAMRGDGVFVLTADEARNVLNTAAGKVMEDMVR